MESRRDEEMEMEVNSISIQVPVIVQSNEENGEESRVKISDVPLISPPTILSVPELGNGVSTSSGSLPKPNAFAPPSSKSLLGADLLQTPASLTMPPPSLTKVKKARNLVSPGMSMVKWMKLQESRVRPPTRKKIPLSEIAKHDKESDCWMVIRNCVYDCTDYLPYHPGGVPELMKGAGKDATALFNEIHRWVNFDSILRSCLQGYLQVDVGDSFDEAEENIEEVNKSSNSIVPLTTAPAAKVVATMPLVKFTQDDAQLVFQVDNIQDDELSEDSWTVSILNRERFLLKVVLKPPDLWMAHVKLLEALSDDSLRVNFQNSFRRAVITLNKPSIGKWKSLGAPLADNNRLLDSRQSQVDDFSCGTIVEKQELTRDVILLGVEMTSSSHLGIPVGFHVKIRLEETGIARKYTPVLRHIEDPQNTEVDSESRRLIYFIVKIYPDGLLTKDLGLLQVNSQLEVGAVAGRYDHSFLMNCDTLALFAGGSGITPFIRIIDFLGKRRLSYPLKRIILVFFNHSESDIIWREEWRRLKSSWNTFHFFPVISRATSQESWSGLTGRVDDVSLFDRIIMETFRKEKNLCQVAIEDCHVGKFKAMACGSSGFNEACMRMLQAQSVVEVTATADDDVFLF